MYEIILLLVLLVLGYTFGTYREKRHYQRIYEREKALKSIFIFDIKHIPETLKVEQNGHLVQGHVVISVDYFKRFVAGLRLFFGGNLKSYETLLDRGRREAVIRMKEQAEAMNANMIFNVKFETASISKGAQDTIGSVEVLVYGTCITAYEV